MVSPDTFVSVDTRVALDEARSTDRAPHRSGKTFDLSAAALTLQRPSAEVFAVVRQEQVGGELGISEITVKAHRGKMMRKMNADSLPELVRMADRLRLTTAPK